MIPLRIWTHIACLISSPTIVLAQKAAYARPLAMTYINNHSIQLDYTPEQLQNHIYAGGVTQLSSFLLNVGSVTSEYDALLRNLSANGVALFPAIGDARSTGFPIDSDTYKKMAKFYSQYTTSIVLTDIEGYAKENNGNGITNIRAMVKYLTTTLNFTHIQMNPWPRNPNDVKMAYTFPGYPQVDSAVEQVQLYQPGSNSTPPNYTVVPDAQNWLPSEVEVPEILNINSEIQMLINYENPPEQAGLALSSVSEQEAAFTKTIQAIQKNYSSGAYQGRVHWLPPWTKTYDPIDQGTWSFIMKQLAQYS